MDINNTTIDTTLSGSASGLPTILIVFLTLQQLVFGISCTENAFVIVVLLRYLNMKDNANLFILNLAVADFFTGISAGVQIFYVLYPSLSTNAITCMLRYQIVGSMTLASQITVFCLSVDRFMAICHQILYEKILTRKLTFFIMTLPWLISLSTAIATLLGWNRMLPGTRCSYSMIFTPGYFWTISLTVTSLSFFSLMAHLRIFIAIKQFYKRVGAIGNIADADRKLHKIIKGTKVMILITIVFTVCWLPYMTFPFAYANGYEKDINLKNASSWLVFIGMLNSTINPIIYAWYKKDFRNACKKACRCCVLQQVEESS